MPAPPASPAAYDEKDYLNRLDSMVKINLDLVSHRMGWLLVSQSFLFTAFALTAAHVHNPVSEQYKLGHLLDVIPIIGLISCFLVGVSIAAAVWVIWAIKGTRARLEASLTRTMSERFGPASVARSSLADWLGYVPVFLTPIVFTVAWLYVLVM